LENAEFIAVARDRALEHGVAANSRFEVATAKSYSGRAWDALPDGMADDGEAG
jgi:hypothetical protein